MTNVDRPVRTAQQIDPHHPDDDVIVRSASQACSPSTRPAGSRQGRSIRLALRAQIVGRGREWGEDFEVPFDSPFGLAQGIRLVTARPSTRALRSGPAMSEPDGSPEADRQVSRMVRKERFELSRSCERQPLKLLKLVRTRRQTWPVLTNVEHMRTEACARDDRIRTNSHRLEVAAWPRSRTWNFRQRAVGVGRSRPICPLPGLASVFGFQFSRTVMGEAPSTKVLTRNRCPSRKRRTTLDCRLTVRAGWQGEQDGRRVRLSICVPLDAIRAAIS